MCALRAGGRHSRVLTGNACRSRDALKHERQRVAFLRYEHGEGRVDEVFAVAECVSPELDELSGVCTVEDEVYTRFHTTLLGCRSRATPATGWCVSYMRTAT